MNSNPISLGRPSCPFIAIRNFIADARKEIAAANGHQKRTQFPHLVADAAILKVNRIHLWKVLSGRRKSEKLMRRYLELKELQRAA